MDTDTPMSSTTFTAFIFERRLASGDLADVAVAARQAQAADEEAVVLVFDDGTGDQVDLDLRGSDEAVRRRYAPATAQPAEAAPRARGRPRLGVVAREVTLLPEQWDWLASQPGGASVALRKLVNEARRNGSLRERMRRAQERAYKVMVALAGNQPGFEDAARALFANDMPLFHRRIERWPKDIREHVVQLADPAFEAGRGEG